MYEDIRKRLSRYEEYREKLSEINEMIADAEYAKYCVNGIDYSKDRVQSSPRNDGMITVIARNEELFNIRYQIEVNIKKAKTDIYRLTDLIDDYFKRYIIIEKYIKFKTLSQIAREQNKTYKWISKLFNKGLKEISEKALTSYPNYDKV